jgi:hypothetical protein
MEDHDLISYLNKALSIIQQMWTTLINSVPQKVIDKIYQMCPIFVLHGVDKDFEIIRNQIFINPNIPIMEELIDLLISISFH